MTDVVKQKSALRETAVARRRNLADTAGPNAGLRLADHIVAHLSGRPAGVVSGYLPMSDEIAPLPALARLIQSGWVIAMPVVTGKAEPLVFRQWAEGDALEPGPLNTCHPLSSVAELTPDVLLVPLLAFDAAGQRIGWGGGFYDRTIAGLRVEKDIVTLGTAFLGQQVDKVPSASHDELLDGVITEAGVMETEEPI